MSPLQHCRLASACADKLPRLESGVGQYTTSRWVESTVMYIDMYIPVKTCDHLPVTFYNFSIIMIRSKLVHNSIAMHAPYNIV